jgi:DNA-binding beta-propeller fold protein YncE
MQKEEKMRMHRSLLLPTVLACLLLGAAAPNAEAGRALLSAAAVEAAAAPPEGQIEGPCGLAVSPSGDLYLADYYHRTIDRFSMPSAAVPGSYFSQLVLPGSNPTFRVNTLDAVCGLAFDAAGNLYGNEWHQGVVRLTGGEATIDSGESTGLAIDPTAGRLYVDDRTYVAEYALPVSPGDEPLAKIDLGSPAEGYGLAAFGGRVYVADAATNAVKVFEPPMSAPVATIAGQFNSLVDASLAIDPSNEHLLVVDNRQPGFEHPKSAVLEFASAADGYALLGALPGAPVDGGPSGIAVDPDGRTIVTDGNSELGNAFLYGPYEAASPLAAPAVPFSDAALVGAAARAERGAGVGDDGGPTSTRSPRHSATASEVSQSGGVRVSFHGSLSPRTLPRHGRRPIVASVGARIVPLGEREPPRLRRIEIAINRNGRFSPADLPVCHAAQIQPATTSAALAACRRSLVGEGTFSAKVLLPQQAPFPSTGKVYAFNGRWHGRPAILAHVYGTEPLPISYTLPFELLPRRGTFGTLLRASLPVVTGNSGYITGLSLAFGRGRRARGYVSAGCPLPADLRIAAFPFVRVDFFFAGNRKVGSTLVRSCKAKG